MDILDNLMLDKLVLLTRGQESSIRRFSTLKYPYRCGRVRKNNMTKNTKLVWRLGKLPTVEELRDLVKDKIVTQEEAREILFNREPQEERVEKSNKEEVQFLRELIDKLAQGNAYRIVEEVRIIGKPYLDHPWATPYVTWCSNVSDLESGYITMSSGTGNLTIPATFSSIVT